MLDLRVASGAGGAGRGGAAGGGKAGTSGGDARRGTARRWCRRSAVSTTEICSVLTMLEITYARSTALYSSPREFESQYFFIHCRNSRLSCILHLTRRSTGIGWTSASPKGQSSRLRGCVDMARS